MTREIIDGLKDVWEFISFCSYMCFWVIAILMVAQFIFFLVGACFYYAISGLMKIFSEKKYP